MARDRDFEYDYYKARRMEKEKLVRAMLIATSIFMFLFILFYFISRWTPYHIERLQLENEKLKLEIQGMKTIPNLEEKIAILEKKTSVLTSENIDSRLSAIELAINKGDIDISEIKNLQELNSELKKLKTYLFENTDDIIEFKTLQKNYQELKNNQGKYMEADDVRRELNFQQTLLFVCISIFGVLATIFATSWFMSRKKDKKPDNDNEQKLPPTNG